MRLDKLLIEHCSPTLGRLKTANLFSCRYSSEQELDAEISLWNMQLNPKGVVLHAMCKQGGRALIYVCRNSMLEGILQKSDVRDFLQKHEYCDFTLSGCIECLSKRMHSFPEFPHEIGLFLGYPLGDVKGFIENSGKNCKCAGHWKVYSNPHEANKLFQRYKKCRDVYTKLFENQHKSVCQLTVQSVSPCC